MTKTYQKRDIPMKDIKWVRSAAWILSEHLVSTKIDVIYASPLLRAHHTGKVVQGNPPSPPSLILNPNLREQHFGIAEGYPWCYIYPDDMSLDECYTKTSSPRFSTVQADFQVGRVSMTWKNGRTGQSRNAYFLTRRRRRISYRSSKPWIMHRRTRPRTVKLRLKIQ
ncbi:hypothetical protein EV421DRAFT_1769178 [Armillaria borealis]|uniref:Uncharacterized protein n=1 Tax=Armillaria borealis TaxID=47425 RepID=A0AA39K3G9_9AGAR|nr:hypothetical protein EV421DRAFT_1769178 [Armillaria borealis]